MEFKLNTTELNCCHFCALGISKERKVQLTEKILYIANQHSINGPRSAVEVLAEIAPELQTAEEFAAVAWLFGTWEAMMNLSVKVVTVAKDALQQKEKLPFSPGGFMGGKQGEA